MPTHDYECQNEKCKVVTEICTNFEKVPKKCPKCKKGKLVKQFPDIGKIGIDVIGGYEYEYGKKAKLKDPKHKADVLSGRVNPY